MEKDPKGPFGIVFEGLKSTFNTQKVYLKKKSTYLVKKIKKRFKGIQKA
jgi:hypothetical protein